MRKIDEARAVVRKNSDAEENELDLRIKSFKDVEIRILDSSTISEVKEVVRDALGSEAQDRYLRLICRGRLLAPDSSLLRDFSVESGDVLHAVLAAAGVRGGHQESLARGSTVTSRFRGTGIGPSGRITNSNTAIDEDESDEEEGRATFRMGFDRLRDTGLSRSEIAAIRVYFSRSVERFIEANPLIRQEVENAEPDARRRQLWREDAWMQAQGPTSEFRLNLNQTSQFLMPSPEGSNSHYISGFILGFMFDLIVLLLVWSPSVPHKQKIGVLAGICTARALSLGNNGEWFN